MLEYKNGCFYASGKCSFTRRNAKMAVKKAGYVWVEDGEDVLAIAVGDNASGNKAVKIGWLG